MGTCCSAPGNRNVIISQEAQKTILKRVPTYYFDEKFVVKDLVNILSNPENIDEVKESLKDATPNDIRCIRGVLDLPSQHSSVLISCCYPDNERPEMR